MQKHQINPFINKEFRDAGIDPEQYSGVIENLHKAFIEHGKEMKISGGKQLAMIVEEMRTGQKQFFNGDKTNLKQTKEKEIRVDQAVEIIKNRKI